MAELEPQVLVLVGVEVLVEAEQIWKLVEAVVGNGPGMAFGHRAVQSQQAAAVLGQVVGQLVGAVVVVVESAAVAAAVAAEVVEQVAEEVDRVD
jgi:hypothetical protein